MFEEIKTLPLIKNGGLIIDIQSLLFPRYLPELCFKENLPSIEKIQMIMLYLIGLGTRKLLL